MTTKPAKHGEKIAAILQKYELDPSAVWEVRGGAYAIKHDAVEHIAKVEKIKFSEPKIICDGLNEKDCVVVLVTGERAGNGEREWSFGEASKNNNKNAYPWAMAEKRGKDRVVLKLIDTHGLLYSDAEADFQEETQSSAYSLKKNGQWEDFIERLNLKETPEAAQSWWDDKMKPWAAKNGWPAKWVDEAAEEVAKHCHSLLDKKAMEHA